MALVQRCSGFIIFTTASEDDEAVMQGVIAARLRAEPTCRLIINRISARSTNHE